MDDRSLRNAFSSALDRTLGRSRIPPALAITAATNMMLIGREIPDSFWDRIDRASRSRSERDDYCFLDQLRTSDRSSLSIRTRSDGIEPFEIRYAGFRAFRPTSKRPDPDATLDMPFDGSFDFADVDEEVFASCSERGRTYDFLFNKYPFSPYLFLIVPDRMGRHNQFLDEVRDADVLGFVWSLVVGEDRGLRVGYNASGASSSVNQMHFQGYFASQMLVPLESWLSSGRSLSDWPLRGARMVPVDRGVEGVLAFIAEMNERFRSGEDVAYTLEFFPSGVVCMPRRGERTSAYRSSIEQLTYSTGFGFAEMAGTIIAQEPSPLDASGREIFDSIIRVYESLRLT